MLQQQSKNKNKKQKQKHTLIALEFLVLPLSDHNHQVGYFVAMVHAGYVFVSIVHETDVDYWIFTMYIGSFCMCLCMGPQFIVSCEGLLWSIESAQNFDSGETRRQTARKP